MIRNHRNRTAILNIGIECNMHTFMILYKAKVQHSSSIRDYWRNYSLFELESHEGRDSLFLNIYHYVLIVSRSIVFHNMHMAPESSLRKSKWLIIFIEFTMHTIHNISIAPSGPQKCYKLYDFVSFSYIVNC